MRRKLQQLHEDHYTMDQILPTLHGKRYFSVIDTKKGYWHEELDHESSLLCTFNMPFGRHKFKRLPFGLFVSQDIFQRKLDAVFSNTDNITGIADDIIVSGSTPREHDKAFIDAMEAARKHNIGFNSEKLQF